jgi:hypothetical protein
VILFSAGTTTGISRVPAAGGKPAPATTLDAARNETTHRWASFLPDGRHFLYMAGSHGQGTRSESNEVFVAELDSKVQTPVVQERSNVVYASGYLLYVHDGVLMARRFDPGSRKLLGDPRPLAEGVQYDTAYFRGAFAASENGLLLYGTGTGAVKAQLRWFDRSGQPVGEAFGDLAEYTTLMVSPDGKRIAAGIADDATGLPNLWVLDARGARTRLGTTGGRDSAIWSPDGSRIAYAKYESRATSVCVMPAAGGEERRLFFLEGRLTVPSGWSSDGRLLAVQTGGAGSKTKNDIWIVPMDEGKPYSFLATEFDEIQPTFSPDGKWLSYVSDESGRPEIYVVPFPGPGGRWQISTDGAAGGGFSGSGLEVLYGALDNRIFSVDLKAAPSGLEVGESRFLFKPPSFTAIGGGSQGWEKFLLAIAPAGSRNTHIGLVSSWTAGLAK